jgi:hypothetical protein
MRVEDVAEGALGGESEGTGLVERVGEVAGGEHGGEVDERAGGGGDGDAA